MRYRRYVCGRYVAARGPSLSVDIMHCRLGSRALLSPEEEGKEGRDAHELEGTALSTTAGHVILKLRHSDHYRQHCHS